MTSLLEIEHVSKWVTLGESRITILSDISLRVDRGEFVAIMGASGSGKSTLMNLMGLLDLPSTGTLRLLGRDVSRVSENDAAALRCRSVGFIFQSFNLLSYLTARQNVELPMGYGGRSDIHQRSQHLLQLVNLVQRIDAYPTTLSGGERQRVAIARALANEPALILADEPTGSLDSATGTQILDLITQLNRQGSTIVMVTHDGQVAKRARRTLRMRDGKFE